MITLLEGLVDNKLDVFIGGKIFTGKIITIDSAALVVVFQTTDGTNYYLNINLIEAVRLS